MMLSAILIPLAYYFQNMAYVNGVITVVMFVGFLGLTISAMRFFSKNEDAQPLDYVEVVVSKLQELLSYPAWAVLKKIAPFLAVLVIIGSYFLSSHILDKRRLVKGGDTKAGDTKAGDTKAGDTKAGDTKAADKIAAPANKADKPGKSADKAALTFGVKGGKP